MDYNGRMLICAALLLLSRNIHNINAHLHMIDIGVTDTCMHSSLLNKIPAIMKVFDIELTKNINHVLNGKHI